MIDVQAINVIVTRPNQKVTLKLSSFGPSKSSDGGLETFSGSRIIHLREWAT